ncbi:MAG: hypothetical protein HQL64_07540 [Magnetococcales bacterium]|nr:hypothetical protein [Magnetococcales bacterium]
MLDQRPLKHCLDRSLPSSGIARTDPFLHMTTARDTTQADGFAIKFIDWFRIRMMW